MGGIVSQNLPVDVRGGMFEVLPPAARTASPDAQEFVLVGAPDRYKGSLALVLDITASTTETVTVKIEGVTTNGTYPILTSSAALGPVAKTVLRVGPGLTAQANLTAVDIVPRTFRVTVTHAGATSITYSLAGMLV